MLRITALEFGPPEDRSCPVTCPRAASARRGLATAREVSYGGTGMTTLPIPPTSAPAASFDSVILAAVLAECQPLIGASVQRVQQTGPHEIVLSLRIRGRRQALLVSADPHWGRLHLARDAVPAEATPFLRLLRGRLEGAALRAVASPDFERLVALTFETLEGPQDLVVEIMGRHANMILRRDGMIVGALKLVGADRARGRDVLPGRPYVQPPRPRTDPTTVTVDDLLTARDASRGGEARAPVHRSAWRVVLEATGGIGPALAWEACLRAGVDPARALDPSGATAIARALREIGRAVLASEFSPVLYRNGAGTPAAYAAFPMQAFASLHAEASSMSAAVDAVSARAAVAAQIESARTGLEAVVARAASRTARTMAAVAEDARAAEEAEHLRARGELILAYLHQAAPDRHEIEVPGFDGQPVRIALDPRLSGVENAQAYFRKYARAAAVRKRLPGRQAALEAEREFLEEMATAIVVAETADDLWAIEQDLVAEGLRRRVKSARRPPAVEAGRAYDLPGGFRIRAGRSARENARLTFEVAGPDDLWLHARGMPGAHVILTGRGPREEAVAAAAAVAAYYSAGRRSGRVPVDVTRRKHVRKVRGGRPGQVTYANERTLMVAPGLPGDRAP
jgi:predicted ribosome quality control (RQC) complex YloA/Tae2 family protein